MQDNQKRFLLRLIEIPGLGPTRIRALVRQSGSAKEVFHCSIAELCQVEGINLKLAQNIRNYQPTSFAEDQLKKCEKLGIQIISFWEKNYPILLKKIYDPPVLLFVKGHFEEKDIDAISIVGTRTPTQYGRKVAHQLSAKLAQLGLTVVSGFAKGIDMIAHKAALSVGGRTIGVLGNGLDIVYPAEHKKLIPLFETEGILCTEFPLGTKPEAGNFPQRNRIISGLSHGTIVIEAGNRSGAILTAMNAIDQNREVFAVPGRLTDKKSKGCLRLIRHGAIPVDSIEIVLDAIQSRLKYPRKPIQAEIKLDLSREEMTIYSVLSGEPKYIDDIVEESNINSQKVLSLLLTMELKGVVKQLAGKHFIRNI